MLAGLVRAACRLPIAMAPWPPRCCCPAGTLPASRRLALAATPRLAAKKHPESELASLVLNKANDWLSPDDYTKLEALPLDETELPKLEIQQREQDTRKQEKKAARRAMLEDMKTTVERQHGRNARFVIAKMEKAHGGNWTPKKKVSRADMERMRMLHREMPSKYPYDKLSFIFGVSREAVARIVKSKWTPDPAKEKKQAQQRNRVDVAGLLGAGSSTSVAGSLPMPQPAPPPAPALLEGVAVVPRASVGIATGMGTMQPLLAAGASRPDGYVGATRGSSARATRPSRATRVLARLEAAAKKSAGGGGRGCGKSSRGGKGKDKCESCASLTTHLAALSALLCSLARCFSADHSLCDMCDRGRWRDRGPGEGPTSSKAT
jgi:hypothetical protein